MPETLRGRAFALYNAARNGAELERAGARRRARRRDRRPGGAAALRRDPARDRPRRPAVHHDPHQEDRRCLRRLRPAIAGSAIDDLPQIWDGFAKLVRTGLGHHARSACRSWTCRPTTRPAAHDESDTGQQELYVALRGGGAVVAGEQRLPLDPEHLVRVDAGVDRVLTSGPDGPARAVRRRRPGRALCGTGVDG